MKPKISILVPVYNTERYISRCLDSLQNQTFQDFEVIVVGDGSPDNAMQIVEKYAESDNRIKTIYHATNQGLMGARRSGYNNSNGDYIVFVDSDDSLPYKALETLYKEISQSGVDIVMSGCECVGNEIHKKDLIETYTEIGEFSSNEIFQYLLKGQLRHTLWSCIFNAKLFNQELVYYENLTNGEDLVLIYQLIGNSRKIKIIKDITYNYHLEDDSATRSVMTENKINQFFITRNFKYNYLIKRDIDVDVIMKGIAKEHVSFSRFKKYRNGLLKFDSKIVDNLKIPNIFKYISLKQIIKYYVFKLGIKSED